MPEPKRYRKRPIVIEAMQFDGTPDSTHAICDWIGQDSGKIARGMDELTGEQSLALMTPEGNMVVNQGDWVIRGIAGEFYPCKPDIFEKTYEAV